MNSPEPRRRTAIGISLALLCGSVAASAQELEFDPEPHREDVARLVQDALSSGQAPAMLRRLCEAAPSRLAGSPGAEAAVEWARREMIRAGLRNVHLEAVTVPHWERGPVESLVLLGADGAAPVELAACALGGSVGTPNGPIEAEVVEVKDAAELEALGEEARGKFVFFNQPMDAGLEDPFQAYVGAVWQRGRGASEAARRGGVGALVRSMTQRLDDVPHTGAMGYSADVEEVPAVAVSTLAANELSRRLARGERVRVRLELSCRTLGEAPGANVVGELLGRERPEEILVVGGHLDAWDKGVGAHDDGSGCVQALEAARLLLASGLRPRRTIRVVMFANEENGTRGARGYHAAHADEMERHVMALESDRGGFAPRGFTGQFAPESLPRLRAMTALLRGIGAERMDPGYGGVDISPMAADGVPLFGLRPDPQRYFDVHHSANDTLESVHPRELELGAAAMATLLYLVAEDDRPLRRLPAPEAAR